MFSEPLTLTIDYPDSYYTNLPEPIRLGYKQLATLLLRDIGILLNSQEIIKAHQQRQPFEIKKRVAKHVETSFDTIEDILGGNISSQADAIRAGVVEEYSVHRLIKDDATIRDNMEREAIAFMQSLVFLSLNNHRIMRVVRDNTHIAVRQKYDYLTLTFG